MNLLRNIFGEKPKATLFDHIDRQKSAPFYCGTAFCGHSTMKAAKECWQRHIDSYNEMQRKEHELLAAGQQQEAHQLREAEIDRMFPQRNPANWPINRSSASMQAEYIAREKSERESK